MSKPTVIFLDEIERETKSPYNHNSFVGCGGTEQTVVKIAHALAATDLFTVIVEQQYRDAVLEIQGVTYSPIGESTRANYIICLRNPASVYNARVRFPDASVYLWSHDLATPILGRAVELLAACQLKAHVAVSQWHKTQIVSMMKPSGYSGQFKTLAIYNPIDDNLLPSGDTCDKYKLLWTSSPHKGLDLALHIFNNLLSFDNNFKLYVANPGYFTSGGLAGQNVIDLGALSHSEVMDHVRSSLCLFYPNTVFPETFGIVFAETNAVGTPVLTHPLGAALEVLDPHPAQLADCRNPKEVIDRILDWNRGNRPTVRTRPQFRLSQVIRSWVNLLKGL